MHEPGAARAARSNDQPRSRDDYCDAGAALRASIEPALEHIRSRETRVLLAVYWLTASYSRLTDRVYLAQVAAVARISGDSEANRYRHTRRALNVWARRGVIRWVPARGRGRQSCLSLSPNGAKNLPLLAVVPDPKKGADRSSKRGPIEARKGGRSESEKGASSGPPTEKYSEKTPEEDVGRGGRLDKILEPFGYLSRSQRDEFERAFDEDEAGFEWHAQEALRGNNPAALLTDMVRAAAHPRAGTKLLELPDYKRRYTRA
jgi:hypothetical protein